MRKITTIITLIMCLITIVSFGQSPSDSVYILRKTDEMSDKIYLLPSRSFIVSNDDLTIGFRIDSHIMNDFSFGTMSVTTVGLGGCNEKDEIIILFENGEKIIKKSWNDFNCKGQSYFNFSEKEINLLRTNPMSKIRITNGRSYKSYTGEVKSKDKKYFIQLFHAIDNNIIKKDI